MVSPGTVSLARIYSSSGDLRRSSWMSWSRDGIGFFGFARCYENWCGCRISWCTHDPETCGDRNQRRLAIPNRMRPATTPLQESTKEGAVQHAIGRCVPPLLGRLWRHSIHWCICCPTIWGNNVQRCSLLPLPLLKSFFFLGMLIDVYVWLVIISAIIIWFRRWLPGRHCHRGCWICLQSLTFDLTSCDQMCSIIGTWVQVATLWLQVWWFSSSLPSCSLGLRLKAGSLVWPLCGWHIAREGTILRMISIMFKVKCFDPGHEFSKF